MVLLQRPGFEPPGVAGLLPGRRGPDAAQASDPHVRALYAFATVIASRRSVADIAADTIDAGMAITGAQLGRLVLHDAARDELVTAASRGFSRAYLETPRGEPSTARAVARAFAEGRTVVIGDVRSGPYSELGELAGFRGMVSVPLSARSRLLGALGVYHREPHDFVADQVALLELICNHAGLAIENEQQRGLMEQERAAFATTRGALESRVARGEDRRRALMHMLADLNDFNKRLADQRKAMLHILGDYERDRSRLERQTERLDASRRALLHILKDSHENNLRLANTRKAMIHIMGDLTETTVEVQRREQELRSKQEQLVQAAKLATLGELTTGVAHELNNPLNNIGLYIGNVIDLVDVGRLEADRTLEELQNAMLQVRKATEIITHLRTFGRAATVAREAVSVNAVIRQAFTLLQEQLRLRQIDVVLALDATEPVVLGNAIQLEQVVINLLANARDAVTNLEERRIGVRSQVHDDVVEVVVEDTGPGIPEGLEQRIFDPFFTTKDVGSGTGLGLSITYGIVREHQGSIHVDRTAGGGARFVLQLPLAIGATAPG